MWADVLPLRPSGTDGTFLNSLRHDFRFPAVVFPTEALNAACYDYCLVPLITNLDRATLAGTALISSSAVGVPPQDCVVLAFQMRSMPKSALRTKIPDLDESGLDELELASTA